MLFLRTFGGLAIENGGRAIVGAASQRGRLAILAVLAASGGRAVSKDRLRSLFWPESDAGHARAALNQALYALRRDVGERALTVGTTELGLNPDVIRSDVAEFERALVSGDIERAAELYTGPFLDSIHLAGLEEFEGWVERERGRLLAVYQAALESVARDAQSRNDVVARARWWKVLSALDPMSARNAIGGMEALVAAGDRESAIRLGHDYTQLVRARLGVENADPAIAELIERLQRVPGRPVPSQPPSTSAPSARKELPTPSETSPAPSWRVFARGRRARMVALSAAGVVTLLGLDAARRSSSSATEATKSDPHVSGSRGAVSSIQPAPAAPTHLAEPEPRRNVGRVLVMPLSNETRDTSAATFGRLAADWMASGLAQTGLVDVVDAQTTASFLRRGVAQNDTSVPSAPDLRRLATDANAKILVVGRYYSTPESLLVQVMIEDAAHGQLVQTLPTVAVRAGDYPKALARLRERIAGAFATLVDPRVESLVDRSMTAPSLAAYQAYSDGLDCFIRSQRGLTLNGCRSFLSFRAAIRADSTWTLPYVWLMYEYWTNGYVAGVDSLIGILDRRHEPLTELDRYSIEYFRRQRAGDLEGALMAARRATAIAPRSNWTYQAALVATQLHLYQESAMLLRRHDPEHGWARGWKGYLLLLVVDDHTLGDHRTELRDIETAEKTDPALRSDPTFRLVALAALGDSVTVLRVVDSIIANSALDMGGTLVAAEREAAVHGYAHLARQLTDRCLAIVAPPPASTTLQRNNLLTRSTCLYDAGRWADAKAVLERILAEPSAPVNQAEIVRCERELVNMETQLGDSARAAVHMANALEYSIPSSRAGDSLMMLAHIAAIRGMNARAVELLRQATIHSGLITILHRHSDFLALSGYPPFRALFAPRG